MRKTDVIIYGAGPAGLIASMNLKNKGWDVLVIERSKFPRFVIGESLLPKCMEYLNAVNAIKCIEAQDFQKKYGAIFKRGDKTCSFSFGEQYSDGFSWTWQVKRSDFDMTLAEFAQRNDIEILFEHSVEDVSASGEAQVTEIKNLGSGITSQIQSRFVIDASGYGRVIPRLFNLEEFSKSTEKGAVFAHFEDPVRTMDGSNNIIIFSFDENQSWVWMIPFSDGTCSVGVVGNTSKIETLVSDNYTGFLTFVKEYQDFNGRFSAAQATIEPRHILGYSVGVKQLYGNGFILCGNSTEFLDPIFSSGVTLAMASGFEASEAVSAHLSGENIDWHQRYEVPMREGIDVFRTYVDSWYNGDLQQIFFADNIDPIMKRQICSVLAGHVWDKTNPFVVKHKRILKTLVKVVEIDKKNKS